MNTLREIIAEHVKYRKQIVKLAQSDIIKKYSGTMLGWTWAIIRPAIFIAIYYIAFRWGLKVGRQVGEYSYFMWIVAGLLPWFYVRDAFVSGASSIRKYRYMVTKIKFPVSVIPTIENMSLLITNVAFTLIILVYFIISGKGPDIYWIQLPIYVVMMFMFFTSWSLFSGILSTLSKDFLQLIRSLTMALFWLSGVVFNLNNITNPILNMFLLINPVTTIIKGYRNALIYKEWFWSDWKELISFCIVYGIMILLSLFVYKKMKREIADVL